MAISTIDKSQRTAARIAGLAFPISFAIVVAVNFGIFARLIVSGNPAETARNILARETLFRVGIAGNMVYCVGVVVLLTALYVILKPINQNLALLAAFGRLVHGLTWLLATLNLFTALRLLKTPSTRVRLDLTNCRPWRGCTSAASTRTTWACCFGDWEPQLAATCGLSRTTSPGHWLPLV
jgi:hypothetical protein